MASSENESAGDDASTIMSSSITIHNITLSSPASVNITVPGDCIELKMGDYIPWDNPENLVSAQTEALVDRVKAVYVLPLLCVIGVSSNVVNMAVFVRLGVRERINLCLVALSFADLIYMLQNLVLFGERLRPGFAGERFGPVYTFMVNHNLLGLYGFVWVSQFMSAVIATERCLCILSPLRSKTLLTTQTMAVVIVIASIVIVGALFVVSTKFSVVCVYNYALTSSSKALWTSEFYQNNQAAIAWLEFFINGVLSGFFVFIVLTATAITSIKLKKIVHWRMSASSTRKSPIREIALTRMLIGTSCLFVICFLPYFIFRVVCMLVKDLSAGKRYHNLYCVLLWCLDMASFVNSSVNFIFYYSIGSEYRRVFWAIFSFGKCSGGRNQKNHSVEAGVHLKQISHHSSVA